MTTAAPPPAPVLDPQAAARKRRRRIIVSVIVASIAIHFAGAIVAGIWIVARYLMAPPATFEVKKEIRIAAEEREHRMNMAEFDALTPKPSFQDKMASARPTDFALPDLPKLPVDALTTLDPSALVTDQFASIVGAAGAGSGGTGAGGAGGKGGISFMGIQSSGNRVVIMYDVSKTVANAAERAGTPMTKIRDETLELLDKLSINNSFGLVQFARNYAFFRPGMIPVTDANRAAAKAWLHEWFATEGQMKPGTPHMVRGSPGFLVVLREVLKMNPDVIFVISDGGFYQGSGSDRVPYADIAKLVRDARKTMPDPPVINFVGFEMRPDARRDLGSVARSSGGRLREIK